jgi:hypothetical protein
MRCPTRRRKRAQGSLPKLVPLEQGLRACFEEQLHQPPATRIARRAVLREEASRAGVNKVLDHLFLNDTLPQRLDGNVNREPAVFAVLHSSSAPACGRSLYELHLDE